MNGRQCLRSTSLHSPPPSPPLLYDNVLCFAEIIYGGVSSRSSAITHIWGHSLEQPLCRSCLIICTYVTQDLFTKLKEGMDPAFRLFITALPNDEFPLGLLQMCTKVRYKMWHCRYSCIDVQGDKMQVCAAPGKVMCRRSKFRAGNSVRASVLSQLPCCRRRLVVIPAALSTHTQVYESICTNVE